ncbi:MAG: type II toxin-antitoxin system HicA family toxin [Ignavibacteriae bacterium]|nr:type II toxin-antitoxin system HicA family toxin [Ignavibacteriota bacterium]
MKRGDVLRYLLSQGCKFVREGKRHSWWENPHLNKRTSVPRHTEINDNLVRKICKDLGIPFLK